MAINENLLEPKGEPEITENFNKIYKMANDALYIKSSTEGSTKVFKIKVIDAGTLSAEEVTD